MYKPLQLFLLVIAFIILTSCDDTRIYEQNHSFKSQYWMLDSLQTFEVDIKDKSLIYNVYLNVRNSSTYPYYNIYINYSLYDTQGNVLTENLVSNDLFESKIGKPLGQSGIGDVFDHQFLVLKQYQFEHTGKHTFQLQQYMRTDTLQGILAVGIRVEKEKLIN
ncbi:MAG: gliding motility lipoprotein GldH [Cyclobacteriaceae bacterium]|nr:gliding motility lipoprotein GldH [Cyclobacteriaceae bacterium]